MITTHMIYDLFMYSHPIYITEMLLQSLESPAGVSGGLGGGEMHFSSRLEQEAASAFGLLAADAIVQHLGLKLAGVGWSLPTNGGAKVFQFRSLEHSLILGSVAGFFLVPGLPLLFLFGLVLLTGLGPSPVTVVHRMRNG